MYRLFTGMFKKKMLAVGVEGYLAQKKMALELGVRCTPAAQHGRHGREEEDR
jgi:hypothetical protein